MNAEFERERLRVRTLQCSNEETPPLGEGLGGDWKILFFGWRRVETVDYDEKRKTVDDVILGDGDV